MNNNKEYLENFNKIWKEKCNLKYEPSSLPPVDRIIVLGDIHGDFDKLIYLLKKGDLLDNNNNWSGGNAVVVQVGDQIDSCRPVVSGSNQCSFTNYTKNDKSEDIKILKYLTKLHNQAQKEGGAVYSLVGNHELMNVMGDMSYVSYKNLEEVGGKQERINSFRPGNKMANFLACTRKMVLIIGSNLFVHAGIEPELIEKYKINDMNKLLALYLLDQLNNPTEFKEDFMIKNNSPLWTRTFGSINISSNKCKKLMTPLKEVYKVGKIFVGHTPQMDTGINSTCNDSIWRTDIGVSNAFDNVDDNIINTGKRNKYREGQILEILNDKIINII